MLHLTTVVKLPGALQLSSLLLDHPACLRKCLGMVTHILLWLRRMQKVTQRRCSACNSGRLDRTALPGCGARSPCRFHALVLLLLGRRKVRPSLSPLRSTILGVDKVHIWPLVHEQVSILVMLLRVATEKHIVGIALIALIVVSGRLLSVR